MEPLLLFAAMTNLPDQPPGAVGYQINTEALTNAADMGSLIYHLQLHMAEALVQAGQAPDQFTALSDIMQGTSEEMQKVIEANEATTGGMN
jgi:hypothetical protein